MDYLMNKLKLIQIESPEWLEISVLTVPIKRGCMTHTEPNVQCAVFEGGHLNSDICKWHCPGSGFMFITEEQIPAYIAVRMGLYEKDNDSN